MKLILFMAMILVPGLSFAKDTIGYDLLNETMDGPTKTYSMTFEVWSADRDAQEISVTPRSESSALEIKSGVKSWRGAKKGKHFKGSVSVRNASSETQTLSLEIHRKIGRRDDTKTISVQVAPQ